MIDVGSKVSPLDEAYTPTTTPRNPGPITRSIFVIKKAEEFDVLGNDEFVRYGQKITIELNPHLYRKGIWLASSPLSPTLYSPVTRK